MITILKYALALFFTIFMAPGLGHFILGKFKKGAILLGIGIALIMITASLLISSMDPAAIPQNFELMRKVVMNLLAQDTTEMLVMTILGALLWAYAITDILLNLVSELRKKKKG